MYKNKKLLILGANNPQTLRLIDDINNSKLQESFEVIGWIDNDEKKRGIEFYGYKVLGTPEILTQNEYKDCFVVNNITTSGVIRQKTTQQLLKYKLPFVSLIHPSVNTKDVTIGSGVIIHENVVLEADVHLDSYSCIASGTVICHESNIGKYCFISSGVVIAGLVDVKDCATVFLGARVAPRVTIGKNAVISMASAVFSDVDSGSTVIGNPAKKIQTQIQTPAKTLKQRIDELLKKEFPKLLQIDEEEYFADYELLSSVETLQLILAIEKEFAIKIADSEVDEDNIGSLSNLYAFIATKTECKS